MHSWRSPSDWVRVVHSWPACRLMIASYEHSPILQDRERPNLYNNPINTHMHWAVSLIMDSYTVAIEIMEMRIRSIELERRGEKWLDENLGESLTRNWEIKHNGRMRWWNRANIVRHKKCEDWRKCPGNKTNKQQLKPIRKDLSKVHNKISLITTSYCN